MSNNKSNLHFGAHVDHAPSTWKFTPIILVRFPRCMMAFVFCNNTTAKTTNFACVFPLIHCVIPCAVFCPCTGMRQFFSVELRNSNCAHHAHRSLGHMPLNGAPNLYGPHFMALWGMNISQCSRWMKPTHKDAWNIRSCLSVFTHCNTRCNIDFITYSNTHSATHIATYTAAYIIKHTVRGILWVFAATQTATHAATHAATHVATHAATHAATQRIQHTVQGILWVSTATHTTTHTVTHTETHTETQTATHTLQHAVQCSAHCNTHCKTHCKTRTATCSTLHPLSLSAINATECNRCKRWCF